jgi:Flp pilus assembly protein TadG
MMGASSRPQAPSGFFARLLRDRAGNTLAMVAAALFPLLGLIGGGVDMGRGYISQSRLQQACDSGVLAARKRLGTEAAVTGEIRTMPRWPASGSSTSTSRAAPTVRADRTFEMTLEEDYSVTGRATVMCPPR